MISKFENDVTRVAYDLYEKSGRTEGNDMQNWLAAERIVTSVQMVLQPGYGNAIALLEYKPEQMRREAASAVILDARANRQRKQPKTESRQVAESIV